MRPSRPACRGRRNPSTRSCATTRGSPARARAAASSDTSAAPRSTRRSSPIIEQAYLPTEEELERARATVERVEAAGAGTLGGVEFVDAAMLGAAQQIVALAASYGTSTRPTPGRNS